MTNWSSVPLIIVPNSSTGYWLGHNMTRVRTGITLAALEEPEQLQFAGPIRKEHKNGLFIQFLLSIT